MDWNANAANKFTGRATACALTLEALLSQLADELGGRPHVVDPRDGLARVERAGVEQVVRAVVGRRDRPEQHATGALEARQRVLLAERDRRQRGRQRPLHEAEPRRPAVVAREPL